MSQSNQNTPYSSSFNGDDFALKEDHLGVDATSPNTNDSSPSQHGIRFAMLYPNLDLYCGFVLTEMQLEGLILKDVLLLGVKAGILALPIHDAVAVEFQNQFRAKDSMEDVWQTVISEFHKTILTFSKVSFSG